MDLLQIGPDAREELVYVCSNMREMDRREIFCTTRCETPEQFADMLIRLSALNTTGWISILNGEPIAVVGVSMAWRGVAEVCMFATDSFHKVALSVTKFIVRNMIPAFVKGAKVHRAQCFSMNGHTVAHKWLKVLGAKSEGVASGYGMNGEDFTLFSWRF